MAAWLAALLIAAAFAVLLGTFALVSRAGRRAHVRASLLLLALDALSTAFGPYYDLLLWVVVQGLVTFIWFAFYPTDPFLQAGGVAGPLVLASGVAVSTGLLVLSGAWALAAGLVSAAGVADEAMFPGMATLDIFAQPGRTAVGSMATPAFWVMALPASAAVVWVLFGSRIRRRWRLATAALKALS